MLRTSCRLTLFLLIASLSFAQEPGTAVIELQLTAPAGGPWPEQARVTASGPNSRQEMMVPLPGGTTLVATPGQIWTIEVDAKGLWGPPAVVLAPGATTIRMVPSGFVSGKVVVGSREILPGILRMRFSSPAPGSPSGEQSLPIQPTGELSCKLPAGTHDLSLRAEGFVSLFYWDRAVPPGVETSLGPFRLVRGDSVTGWIATEDGEPIDDTASVTLRPAGEALPADARRQLRLAALDMVTRPAGRGFFHFAGVAPGDYEVVASQRGYTDARVAGVPVWRGFESKVAEDLVLSRPRTAMVQVQPTTSPRGDPWQVLLFRSHAPSPPQPLMVATDDDGVARFPDLAAGRYHATVTAGSQRWARAEFDLVDREQTVWIEVDLVRVEGLVLLGKEPLPHAKVVFGGRTSIPSVALQCDAGGSFSGSLPRTGDWVVEISADEPRVWRTLRRVPVTPKPRRDYAEVEISLPASRLHGRVVDERRQPVPRAFVRALPQSTTDAEARTRADDAGLFELAGLPPGLLEAQASTQDSESDTVVVTVLPDGDTGPVELVVRTYRPIAGRVLGPGGPVPGAYIYLRPVGETFHGGDQGVTDALGSFSLRLAAGVREVFARVMAVGHAFTNLRIPVPDNQELIIQVGRAMGTVDLRYPADHYTSVFAVNSATSNWLQPFLDWAQRFGNEGSYSPGHAVVPRLNAGTWHFCFVEPGSADWAAVWAWGQVIPQHCQEVRLAPGQTVTVDLTDPAQPTRSD